MQMLHLSSPGSGRTTKSWTGNHQAPDMKTQLDTLSIMQKSWLKNIQMPVKLLMVKTVARYSAQVTRLDGFLLLGNRPYFKRVWVLQELVLATSGVAIMSGWDIISFRDFLEASSFLLELALPLCPSIRLFCTSTSRQKSRCQLGFSGL